MLFLDKAAGDFFFLFIWAVLRCYWKILVHQLQIVWFKLVSTATIWKAFQCSQVYIVLTHCQYLLSFFKTKLLVVSVGSLHILRTYYVMFTFLSTSLTHLMQFFFCEVTIHILNSYLKKLRLGESETPWPGYNSNLRAQMM